MDHVNVSKLIGDIRSRNYLTLEALSRRLNVSLMTVFNWEKGRARPLDANLLKLKEVFPDEFATAEETRTVV